MTRRGKEKKRRKSSGGALTNMRSGFKGFVGRGPRKKESKLAKAVTFLLLAAAIALLVYRFMR